jgi:hypothetical protein
MTGLADPTDPSDFYERFPELRDLDAAVRTAQESLAAMVELGASRNLDGEDEQSLYEARMVPGHVYMMIEDKGRTRLVTLAVVDRYTFDPDAEESR